MPIILGTPTIGQVVNVMKEAKMDALAMPWANARAAHLLAVHRMAPAEVEDDGKEGYDPSREGFVMHTQKCRDIRTFSST